MNKIMAESLPEKKTFIKLLSSIRSLPSMPVVMVEVSKLLSNPLTSAADLGKVISTDQGLVAKILAVANSPLYGIPRRVSTIEFAIVILGFDHIKNIVMALSMIEAFKRDDGKNWDNASYWVHSLMTASAAKRIADELRYQRTGEVFTAGLLHDLGITIIQRYFNSEFNAICGLVDLQEMRYLKAEEQTLGLTHQEIGQLLANRWNLPESLGETIAFHHLPSSLEENKVLASIVHLADYMTQRLGIGCFYWDDNIQLDENIIDILKFGNESNLNRFIDSHEELFKSQLESVTF
ncbi:MAG: HDOD domain-containing protein [Ignavibacteriaceae bacterium]|jgi:putative nucleotidyltransferase with HDIG domain